MEEYTRKTEGKFEEKIDYIFDTLEESITKSEGLNSKKMKTLWHIEQDPQKKRIEIYSGSDGCISLPGVQEAKQFIEVLEKAIEETFSL